MRALVTAGVLIASIAAAPTPGDVTDALFGAGAAAEEGVGSDNIEHVRNLVHTDPSGEPAAKPAGSDIEFFEISYPVNVAVKRLGGKAADLDGDRSNGIQRRYAVAGTTGNGMHIYDITVPAETFHVSRYDCPANQGDPQIFTRDEDGLLKTYTTYTTEDSRPVSPDAACAQELGGVGDGIGTFVIDITDPYAPKARAFIPVPEGSHNGTVHPSGDYFYNSNSSLYHNTAQDGGPGIEYYDISDLDAIERLGRLPLPPIPASLGTESHDITFNEDGSRAYSAALSQGVIIDTSDPAKPKILTSFVDPTINVWHQADPIQVGERTILVVEDEFIGAIGTGQCPNGGVHIFDVTGDPAVPQKLGYWNIDEPRVMAADGSPAAGGCSAHVFRLYPDAGLMTIAYYNGGVRVVDLKGLAGIGLGEAEVAGDDAMVQLAYHRFPDSNSWAVKTPEIAEDGSMYLFSNDRDRGLDVYFVNGSSDDEAAAMGRWMTPQEAAVELTQLSPAELQRRIGANGFSCLL